MALSTNRMARWLRAHQSATQSSSTRASSAVCAPSLLVRPKILRNTCPHRLLYRHFPVFFISDQGQVLASVSRIKRAHTSTSNFFAQQNALQFQFADQTTSAGGAESPGPLGDTTYDFSTAQVCCLVWWVSSATKSRSFTGHPDVYERAIHQFRP